MDEMSRLILGILVFAVLFIASFLVPYLWMRILITIGLLVNALLTVKQMRRVSKEKDGV